MDDDDLDPDFADDGLDEPAAPRAAAATVERRAARPVKPVPELRYSSVVAFVEEHLSEIYARRLEMRSNTIRWCPRWWAHPEVLSRLEALWRSWEFFRLDPTSGMTVWWRDYADPTMTVIFDPDGPLFGCSERGHAPGVAALPVEPMPDRDVLRALSDPTKELPR